jgi:hypothetical protein
MKSFYLQQLKIQVEKMCAELIPKLRRGMLGEEVVEIITSLRTTGRTDQAAS